MKQSQEESLGRLKIFLVRKKKIIYKSVRVGHFWSKKYIEIESNGDEKYLNKIRPYLNDMINDRKKSDT